MSDLKTNQKAADSQNVGKVYWRDLDATKDQILASGSGFTVNGRLIYWHGHEASEAQNWLADEAQAQRRVVARGIQKGLSWIADGKSGHQETNQKADAPAAKPAHKVLYSTQCPEFSPSSIERCALCLNHPSEHSFPVTAQRDELLAACKAAFHGMDNLCDKLIEAKHSPADYAVLVLDPIVNKAYDLVRAAIRNAEHHANAEGRQ
jgi:hypothetical protein